VRRGRKTNGKKARLIENMRRYWTITQEAGMGMEVEDKGVAEETDNSNI